MQATRAEEVLPGENQPEAISPVPFFELPFKNPDLRNSPCHLLSKLIRK